MQFYTVLLEYAGGTYISQIEANCEKSAYIKWAGKLDTKSIVNLGEKGKECLVKGVENQTPIAIKNIKNVWLATVLVRGKVAFINIILTER